jgi:hypothetical protein
MKIKATAARLAATLLLAATCAQAQEQKPADKSANQSQSTATTAAQPTATTAPSAAAATKNAAATATTPLELARATYASIGGDKYRDLKNMVLFGTADLYSPNSAQSLSGKFGMITAGDQMRLEVQSPLFNFSLVSDGARTYTSMRGFDLPPANKFGIPVLLKFDQAGYVVTALSDKKKERAFRITEPDGNTTDFYVDVATGRLLRFVVPYGVYTYGVEFKTVRELDGVLVPVSFVQRISTGQGDFFAEFKVKDAKLNQQLPADTFTIPHKTEVGTRYDEGVSTRLECSRLHRPSFLLPT